VYVVKGDENKTESRRIKSSHAMGSDDEFRAIQAMLVDSL
jgi:hypothetical protein